MLLLLLRAIIEDQGTNHIVVEHLRQIGRFLVYLHLRLILLRLPRLMQLLIQTLLVLILSVVLTLFLVLLLLILLTVCSLQALEQLEGSACGLRDADSVVRLGVGVVDLVGLIVRVDLQQQLLTFDYLLRVLLVEADLACRLYTLLIGISLPLLLHGALVL